MKEFIDVFEVIETGKIDGRPYIIEGNGDIYGSAKEMESMLRTALREIAEATVEAVQMKKSTPMDNASPLEIHQIEGWNDCVVAQQEAAAKFLGEE